MIRVYERFTERTICGPLLAACPKDWVVDFRPHAPYNTIVEGAIRSGEIETLRVISEERGRAVSVKPLKRRGMTRNKLKPRQVSRRRLKAREPAGRVVRYDFHPGAFTLLWIVYTKRREEKNYGCEKDPDTCRRFCGRL